MGIESRRDYLEFLRDRLIHMNVHVEPIEKFNMEAMMLTIKTKSNKKINITSEFVEDSFEHKQYLKLITHDAIPVMYYRKDSNFPYQKWEPFPPEAIVQVYNKNNESRIDVSKNICWDYWHELNELSEGVVMKARRLDRSK